MVMTDEVVQKLDEAFLYGLSDRQACLYAGINYSTFTEWIKRNPDYCTKKETLKENPKLRAKINIAKSISEGNLFDSKWYLEKTDKEFTNKQEIDLGNKDDKPFEVNIKVVE